jgi:hypothetical protein
MIHPPKSNQQVTPKMSSTIVPGVSDKLGFEYLKSYLDESTSDSRFIVDDNNSQTRQLFSNGTEAAAFIARTPHIYMSIDYSDFDIYLNRYNLELKITQKDLRAFCELETDEELYEMFRAYADKMADRIDLEEVFEDEEETEDGEAQAEDLETDETDTIEELRNEIEDIASKWCESDIKLNRQIRDVAMDFIHYMEPIDFDKRVLSGMLPQFPRAVPGNEDYRTITPRPEIFVYPKRRLTGKDIDSNVFNFAYAKREYLRCMSEADFIKLCYTDIA